MLMLFIISPAIVAVEYKIGVVNVQSILLQFHKQKPLLRSLKKNLVHVIGIAKDNKALEKLAEKLKKD